MAGTRGKHGSAGSLRYRDHSPQGTRTPRGLMRFADHEWGTIVAVAAQAGWSPAAWAQQVAFASASRRQHGLAAGDEGGDDIFAALQQVRRLLTTIGGNLHDVASAATATGTLPTADTLDEMLGELRKRVQMLDTYMAVLRPGLMP
jgi:enamine deaminase RidA (YjgF/YER057c/UK114 family)